MKRAVPFIDRAVCSLVGVNADVLRGLAAGEVHADAGAAVDGAVARRVTFCFLWHLENNFPRL